MRLFESYEGGALSRSDFIRALSIIASYIVRRAVLNIQIRDYWAVFTRVAHEVDDDSPFESFQVALARQSHRFPSDEEFMQEIQKRDLYSLRSCLYILRQLENVGQNEPSPIDQYSIEHIMPQSIDDVPQWQQMLGEDWKSVHDSWLHRLGNLTLTAYNSTYSNRPFDEKKSIRGGFNQSAVRLNEYVRNQTNWTIEEMEERGSILAERAIAIWPHHKADEKLIQEAKVQELRDIEDRQDLGTMEMSGHVRELIASVNESIREMGNSIRNIENRSVCHYDYAANFFLEMLPMKHYIRLFIPIEFDEVDDPQGVATDVTTRFKRLPNVVHKDCGVYIEVREEQQIASVMPIIRQAFNMVTQR